MPDIVTPSLLDSMEVGEEFLPHALSWSIVDPALYRSFADLQSIIPILKKESDERRGSDPRFQAYVNLIARLGERQKTKEMSLNLNDRLDLARSEKQLQKLIENTDPKDGAESAKNQDVVLDESMHILVDFINLQRQNHQDSIAASDSATNKPAL